MPYLIKSSGGQRSCQLLTNREQQAAADIRSDLIEALRGLTFQFEVKIVDIVPTDTAAATASAAAATSTTETSGQQQQQQLQQPDLSKVNEMLSNGHNVGGDAGQLPKLFNTVLTSKDGPPKGESKPRSALNFGPLSSIRPPAGHVPIERSVRSSSTRAEDSNPPRQEPVAGVRRESVEEPRRVREVKKEPEVAPPPPLAKTLPPALAKEEEFLIHPDMMVTIPVKKAEVCKPRDVTRPMLIKGNLKIGTTMESLCVNVGGSEDSPIPFITYNEELLLQITNKIQEISCDISARPKPSYVEVGDVVYAKSKEDNVWYRAIVQFVNDIDVEVYYFDWGLTEGITLSRIRRLTEVELGLSKCPACAIRVKFTNEPGPLVDEALGCERRFSIRVESYDDADETYTVTILKILDI